MLSIFSASALAASSRVKCGSCISTLSFSQVPCNTTTLYAQGQLNTTSRAMGADGRGVAKCSQALVCSRALQHDTAALLLHLTAAQLRLQTSLPQQVATSCGVRTCVTIWLISMALSAGLSQPLLLMTSTMACSRKANNLL